MDSNMISYFDWVDSLAIQNIQANSAIRFGMPKKQSDLELQRFGPFDIDFDINAAEGDFDGPEFISNVEEIDRFAKLRDACHIFSISQKHSFARLSITQDLFGHLVDRYTIFDQIWGFVLPFSFKTRESDIGQAPLRFRQKEDVFIASKRNLGSFECAYGFHYVELNHREKQREDNPDYDPWSMRQTAVYQQYDRSIDRFTFVLISPSPQAKANLESAVRRGFDSKIALNPFELHRVILSTLHENWMHYIRSLEKLLMLQSDLITLAHVRSETVRLSPLEDFTVNFIDRQRLKHTEDKVLDLVIVFESLYSTLSQLLRQCRLHCVEARCQNCVCSNTSNEIEEQMLEVQMNLKKVDVLRRRAKGTAHLLSDLLDYENAQIAHQNEKSLNKLVQKTNEENSKMRLLTERSTRDAATVKILTVITLVYLPVTVVLNFFSTQLIRVDDTGHISIILQSWWFIVVAIPLTIVTFIIWRVCLLYAMRNKASKEPSDSVEDKGSDQGASLHQPNHVRERFSWLRQRSSTLPRIAPRRTTDLDLESTVVDPSSPTSQSSCRKEY